MKQVAVGAERKHTKRKTAIQTWPRPSVSSVEKQAISAGTVVWENLLMVNRVAMLRERKGKPKEKAKASAKSRGKGGGKGKMFEVGEGEETWEEVEEVMKNHLGVVMHPKVDCKWLCLAFTAKITKVRLSFPIPGLALIVEMMRFVLIHIHMSRTLVRHCFLQLVFLVEIMKITGGLLILGLLSLFCLNRL